MNAAVNASAPLLADMRIQAAVSGLSREGLDVQQQTARQELESAGEGAVPALTVALGADNPVLRQNAAEMLGYIGSPQAVTALSNRLQHDPVPQVRQNAAWALGEIQDLSTLNMLQQAGVLDKSPMVRLAAADSIARLRTRLTLAAGVNEQDLSAFAIAPSNPKIAYLAKHRDLTMTYDGGKTWQTFSKALPSLITTLAVSSLDAKVMYASAEGPGLLKSADGGATWSAINAGLGVTPGAQFSVTAIALDSTDSQRMFATTGVWIGSSQVTFFPIAVMRSIDGGTTWQVYEKSTNVEPITQLAFKGDRLYVLAGEQVQIH